jgi:hypothetical protein
VVSQGGTGRGPDPIASPSRHQRSHAVIGRLIVFLANHSHARDGNAA